MTLKKAALRVNPVATLESFTPTTGDKVHAKYRTGFVPTEKDPDAVPPNTMSVWDRGVYKPEPQGYQRPGANDFLNVKSRGL
jgi:hypothetical protein